MRKSSYLAYIPVSLIICLLVAHCQKGDTGPAGPQGQPGPTGSQGPKGDTGVANVIYSAWLDLTYSPDTIRNSGILDTIGYYVNIPAPQLSTSILSGGEMKVYVNLGTSASPDVAPLPYTDIYSGLNITPEFYPQKISLYSNANVSTFTQGGLKYLQYRYILIPGGVTSQSIDWNNYHKVATYLKLNN